MDKTLIKKPIITEKATQLASANQYVFLVAQGATAPEIKKAIEGMYKVTVRTVRTITVPSKTKRLGRNLFDRPAYRKAIVTLKKGDTLDVLTV